MSEGRMFCHCPLFFFTKPLSQTTKQTPDKIYLYEVGPTPSTIISSSTGMESAKLASI